MKSKTVDELLAWHPPQVTEYIAGGLLQEGGRMVLFGRWQTFKSMLAIHAGFSISTGQPWLGFNTTPTTVLSVNIEIPEPMFRDRIESYVRNTLLKPSGLSLLTEPFLRLDQPKHMLEFQKEIVRVNPKVIILDPFYRLFSGNITDNFQVQYLLDKFDELIAKWGLSVILIGHTRKPQAGIVVGDWGQELIGGSYIMNWVDTAISVEPLPVPITSLHDVGRIRLRFDKTRHARHTLLPMTLEFDKSNMRFTVL